MRPLTVVDGVCGKTGADSSSGGMSAHVPLLVEAAPQRPQVARDRVRREVALQDPTRGKSTRPKYKRGQGTRPKYKDPAKYQDPELPEIPN